MEIRPGTTGKYKLRDFAQLTGWSTARVQDCRGERPETVAARRAKQKARGWGRGGSISLDTQARGVISELFLVPTGVSVGLAPEFSLWLQGYPEAWMRSAPNYDAWRKWQDLMLA